jgi:hypothetical protein
MTDHLYSLKQKKKNKVGSSIGIGCLSWFLVFAFMVAPVVQDPGSKDTSLVPQAITSLVVALALTLIIQVIRYGRIRNAIDNEELAIDEARWRQAEEQLRTYVMNALQSSSRILAELPHLLRRAENALMRAEAEYHESAFGPFWDAVEESAHHLVAFHQGVQTLHEYGRAYAAAVKGKENRFPPFGQNLNALPDPASTLVRFRRVVRRGQTDPNFANIWEHRQTRQVLIAGFKTLGTAINNLPQLVEMSLSELINSLSPRSHV